MIIVAALAGGVAALRDELEEGRGQRRGLLDAAACKGVHLGGRSRVAAAAMIAGRGVRRTTGGQPCAGSSHRGGVLGNRGTRLRIAGL